MPFQFGPTMDYDQLYKDRARALAVTPKACPSDSDQLPAYSEAVTGRPSVHVQEKDSQQSQPKKSSTLSAIKSVLTLGNVQKHNPSAGLQGYHTHNVGITLTEIYQQSQELIKTMPFGGSGARSGGSGNTGSTKRENKSKGVEKKTAKQEDKPPRPKVLEQQKKKVAKKEREADRKARKEAGEEPKGVKNQARENRGEFSNKGKFLAEEEPSE